jgi:hypothetical protein
MITDDHAAPPCDAFAVLDDLAVDHIASFLNLHAIYRWVCACKGESTRVLSAEWFFRQSLLLSHGVEWDVLPLDEDAQERFYLAGMLPQMRMSQFIPKFCVKNPSFGIGHIAKWLDVDPSSIYVESIALFLGRLLDLAQRHAVFRVGYSNVYLWDVLWAARFFGFSTIPDHDRVFEIDSPRDGGHSFVTTGELCSTILDPVTVSALDHASVNVMRSHMRSVLEELMLEELDDGGVERIVTNMFDTLPTVPMDQNDNIDMESWLLEQLEYDCDEEWSTSEWQRQQDRSIGEQVKIEFHRMIENLRSLYLEIDDYDLEDFGVCLPVHRLKSSPSELLSYLKEMGSLQRQKYTNSAVKFIQMLIADIHFGSAVEAKIKKKGPVEQIFEFGVLFGENGTSWKTLLFAEDVDQMSDVEDDDEDYCLSEDEDMDE